MRLTKIALTDFRNYAQLEAAPAPGLNVFVGANAQGKSNLLEAIAILGTGKSFRTAHDADTVRFEADNAAVRGEASIAAGTIVLACAIAKSSAGTRKTYTVNGRGVRYSHFLGKLRVVTFVPSDLQLASGPPSLRRAFLNTALSQEYPHYYRELARYRKAVQQKNAILRGAVAPDPQLLRTYDATLVESGTKVMLSRARFVAELAEAARSAHARFSVGHERLEVTYRSNVPVEAWNAGEVVLPSESAAAKPRSSARITTIWSWRSMTERWPPTVRRVSGVRRCWR
jgi:DNA replication and repair protein RecF